MKKRNKRWRVGRRSLALLALTLAATVASGLLLSLMEATLALTLGTAIFNRPYTEPFPASASVVFGPDLTAWSRYQDHPGYDTAYTAARSQAYAGIASPNHIYTGSNALTFFGYNGGEHLDYILSEEYSQFSGVSYELRPAELNFSALSQSGFLFNGSVTDVGGDLFYSGYMIALEANSAGTSADLRLYYVTNAPLSGTVADFEDTNLRTPISTYAVGITPGAGLPVFVRVEADPVTQQFQVYINGELRTQDLPPVTTATSFGFFATSADRATTNLTKATYSNLRIQAPWVSKQATATVYFREAGTNTDIADPQTETGYAAGGYGGQNGQNHYIIPPNIPGYIWANDPNVALDYIPYFARNEYNETILYYVKDTANSTKTAWYDDGNGLVQDNGTAAQPVLVEKGKTIEYEIYAAGNGTRYAGNFVANTALDSVISMSGLYPNVPTGQGGAIGTSQTTTDGRLTVESNYNMVVSQVSSNNSGRIPNEGWVVGFAPQPGSPNQPPVGTTSAQGNLDIKGQGLSALPYVPACGTSGMGGHTISDTWAAGNKAANHALVRPDERYIKLTYNNLPNDAGYQIFMLLGAWGNAQPQDYIITIVGCDSIGNDVTIEINRLDLFNGNNGTTKVQPFAADNDIPWAIDYADPYLTVPPNPAGAQQFVFPKDGKLEVIVTRIHNSRHDHNILVGASQLTARAREPVMRVVDDLPLGLQYVPGSSGQYEGNLTITTLPNGQQRLVWSFGVLPPGGYNIPFQAKVVDDGLFINHADVEYIGVANAIPNERTNNTYHWTGTATVIEHFRDINDPLGPKLRLDNTLKVYRGNNYTTSQSSLNTILTPGGDTYRYVGYSLDGGTTIIKTKPPNPTIQNVTGTKDIDLYFEKNPVVTVEFYDIDDVLNLYPLRPSVEYPVNYEDPFYLPDSARAQITIGPVTYTYCAYDKTENGSLQGIFYGLPDKPVYIEVKEDQTIIVYFTKKPAVTVRFVEYQNTANVLKNNHYEVIGDPFPDNNFDILNGDLYEPIYSMGKWYRYVGYSYTYPTAKAYDDGFPDQNDFDNITVNMEIVLQFEEVTNVSVLEQFRNLDNRLDEMTIDNPVAIPFASDYVRGSTPLASYSHGGRTYYYAGYDLNDGTGVHYGPAPEKPFEHVTTDDKVITYLYAVYSITEEFHRLRDEAELKGDNPVDVPYDGAYDRTTTGEPLATITTGGRTYAYVGYSVDGGTYYPSTVSATPTTPITGVTADGRKITYYYEAYYVTEEFRLWTNPAGTPLKPDNDVSVPHGGDYVRSTTGAPPASLPGPGGQTYYYVGYDLNDGTGPKLGNAAAAPITNVTTEGKKITYLYGVAACVTEEFRLWGDRGTYVDDDNPVPILFGGDYDRSLTGAPPATITAPDGKTYVYVGYDLYDGEGPQLGDAPDTPFENVVTDDQIITYYYQLQEQVQTIALHIRQVVIDPLSEVQLPVMGYYTLENGGDTLPLTSDSVSPGYLFTDYTLIPGDDLFYYLTDIIPQYYEFLGHFQNDGDTAAAGHDIPTVWASPGNGFIELDYSETGEIWVTVYITPRGTPGKNQVSVETNRFGTVYDGEPPIEFNYLSSITAIENSEKLRHANIVLCLDMSSSMQDANILGEAITAADIFIRQVFAAAPVDISLNLITYNYTATNRGTVDENDYWDMLELFNPSNPARLKTSDAAAGTNMAATLDMAYRNLYDEVDGLAVNFPWRNNYVIFIGDGRASNNNTTYQHVADASPCTGDPGVKQTLIDIGHFTEPICTTWCTNPAHQNPPYWDYRNMRYYEDALDGLLATAVDIKQSAKIYGMFFGEDKLLYAGAPEYIQLGMDIIKQMSSWTLGDPGYYYEATEESPSGTLAAELLSILHDMARPWERAVAATDGIVTIDLLHPLDTTKPVTITVNGGTPVSYMAGSFPLILIYNPGAKQLIFDVTSYPKTADIVIEYWIRKMILV